MANKVINMRGFDCPHETEAKYNKWYDEVHVPMIFESGQVKAATRYERLGDDKNTPKHLVIFEFESEEAFKKYNTGPQMALLKKDVEQTWHGKGSESKWRVQYKAVKTWKK